MQRDLEKLCKKVDHGMKDLQPILAETLKQDSSRHQVWNVDKLYIRIDVCRHLILHPWFNQGRWLEWPFIYPKFMIALYVLICSLHIIKMILRF